MRRLERKSKSCLGRRNYILRKVNGDFGCLQEVNAQEALNTAFRREVMTNYLQFFNFNAQAFKASDFYKRRKDNPIGSGNFNMPLGSGRVDSYGQGCFYGNHREGSAGIYCQLADSSQLVMRKLGFREDNSVSNIKVIFTHTYGIFLKLECRCEAFGKPVFRIFHEGKPFSIFYRQQLMVDLVTVRAVEKEFSRDGSSAGLIHFIYLNEQPLSVEPFFDRFNFLRTHFITSLKGYHKGSKKQGFLVQKNVPVPTFGGI